MIEGCVVSNCVNIGRRSVFNYPVRFVEQTVIITVRHRFQKSDLDDREYEVVVDADIYRRLKAEKSSYFYSGLSRGKVASPRTRARLPGNEGIRSRQKMVACLVCMGETTGKRDCGGSHQRRGPG